MSNKSMQDNCKHEKTTQYIFFDLDGFIKESCNTLFPTGSLFGKKIQDIFPFIDSIFPELCQLHCSEDNIIFRKIATKHTFLPGFYDYQFNATFRKNQHLISWRIKDRTSNYRLLRKMQQKWQEATFSS